MTEFRHLTDRLAMASVSWVVRFAYGLLVLALAAVVALEGRLGCQPLSGRTWPNRSLMILTLPTSGEDIVDEQTGTIWDPGSRRALEGPLEGEILDISAGFTSFEEDTLTLWPDARIWEGGCHNERGEERLLTSVARRPDALEPVSGLWVVEKAGTPAPIG